MKIEQIILSVNDYIISIYIQYVYGKINIKIDYLTTLV